MKKMLLILPVFCAGILFAQQGDKIESKVVSATVFKNRALVTREADCSIKKGKHKIVFSNLPVDLLDETVRVSAEGIKILDVKVEQRFTPETQQKIIKLMEHSIDSLQQLIKLSDDRIAVYSSKKEFVEALKAKAALNISEKMLTVNYSPKEWSDMLAYIDNSLTEIYKGTREQNYKKGLYNQEILAIRSEIERSQGLQSKNYKEIIINIESDNKAEVKIFPSYMVQNANWYPVYDARVSSQQKDLELSYYGLLQQSTGEDWNDIQLTLSTAEPLTTRSIPDFERWFVDTKPLNVNPEQNYPNPYNTATNVRGGRVQDLQYSVQSEKKVMMEEVYTNVNAKELSTTFEVPSANSIPSDNSQHKVTIAISRMPVEFRYTTMPKMVKGVFLKGKITNQKEYPLLAGIVNVYVDNDFINKTNLNTTVPTDTFELALGTDDKLQSKKVLIKKFQESKGFLGGKKQVTYEYEIQLQNNRTTEETVSVYDQLPIPMNEDIKVELLEPKKDKSELGNDQKLEWKISLKPGDKKSLPFKFQVICPDNAIIYGLE
jgi:uncharacterized protein (TIGR02231 family)